MSTRHKQVDVLGKTHLYSSLYSSLLILNYFLDCGFLAFRIIFILPITLNYFVLEYSRFAMLFQFLLQNKVDQLYVYIYPLFFVISFPFRSWKRIQQSTLCYTVVSHQLSALHILVYICQSQFSNSFHPLSPLVIHTFVSLHLCLHFCFADKFICITVLGSTCK